MWMNQGSATNDTDSFNARFLANADLARSIVRRAVDDWNVVISDQNADRDSNPNTNNVFELTLNAAFLSSGIRGDTEINQFTTGLASDGQAGWTVGVPTRATVRVDDNAAGAGWYFDRTPVDDAEFTAIANSGSAQTGTGFAASFIDINGQSARDDFYRTVLHEIGHALGLTSNSDAALDDFLTPLYRDSTHQQALWDPTDIEPFTQLKRFQSGSLVATFIGGHLYEGDLYGVNNDPLVVYAQGSSTPLAFVTHPNELLNPGRSSPAGHPDPSGPRETARQWISDLDAQILGAAYSYTFVLPSTFNTAHVTLDDLTGTLLIQGRTNYLDDTFEITTEGTNNETIRVVVNGGTAFAATERVSRAKVTQILVAGNGGGGTLPPNSPLPWQEIKYVVSTNQDSADYGTGTGDQVVDIDSVVPGFQVPLRAALIDASGSTISRSIYVPRGNYKLTSGAGGATTNDPAVNDLNIHGFTAGTSKDIAIVGTGAGSSVIDATGFGHRIFDLGGAFASLKLSRLTLTGGNDLSSSGGGAIVAHNGASLELDQVAVVGNTTNDDAGGGGIRASQMTQFTVRNSVFANNTVTSATGKGAAVYFNPGTGSATFTVGGTVFAKNEAATHDNVYLDGTVTLRNEGNNVTDDNEGSYFSATTSDHIDTTTAPTDLHVVTNVADVISTTDGGVSLREAVIAANAGNDTIWLPAWNHRLTISGSGGDSEGDLDITGVVTIVGAGAGLSIINAAALKNDDRIFDVVASGDALHLSRVTLTGGNAPSETGQRDGGAIRVQSGGQLHLSYSVIVGNDTGQSGKGGGVYFAATSSGSIEASVIAVNTGQETGGIYLEAGSSGTVTLKSTIIANNSPTQTNPDVYVGSGRILKSQGYNRLTTGGQGFVPHASDYIGTVDYIVTGVTDTFDNSNDAVVRSVRDAINTANITTGTQEIWLPAWHFVMTLTGTGLISQGDFDVSSAIVMSGIAAGATIINAGGLLATTDRIFDLTAGSTLDLSRITLTGGKTRMVSGENGGAINVNDGAMLHLRESAIVGNEVTMGSGGGIFFRPQGEGTIVNSVITGNTASSFGGGIFLGNTPYVTPQGTVSMSGTIVANNVAGFGDFHDIHGNVPRQVVSGGFNRVESYHPDRFTPAVNDYVGAVDYVVTAAADGFNHVDDSVVITLRDAIDTANATSGTQEIWMPAWQLFLSLSGTGDVSQGDMDISSAMNVRGAGPGLSVINAGDLSPDDRIIDVTGTGVLSLSHVTLTLGDAPSTVGQRDGGAIRVQNLGNLQLSYSAIVGNDTGQSGKGGGIYFAPTATGSIEASVITVNTAHEETGGVYLESATGTGGTVTLASTIIANNSLGESNNPDIYVGSNRTLTSLGNNRITFEGDNFFPKHATDVIGPVDYVVTSVADTYDGSADPINMSTRDAIHRANMTAGAQEIWLPAWKFVLSRDRARFGQGSPTDTSVEYGDLDIGRDTASDPGGSLTIRGISAGSTSVAWMSGVAVDEVFDLLGDYDNNKTVHTADSALLGTAAGDGDEDGSFVSDADDINIYNWNLNAVLTVDDILFS
jgi:hypothetical protein